MNIYLCTTPVPCWPTIENQIWNMVSPDLVAQICVGTIHRKKCNKEIRSLDLRQLVSMISKKRNAIILMYPRLGSTVKNDSFPLHVNILENNGILRIPFKFQIMEVAISIIYSIPYNGINLSCTAITGNNGIFSRGNSIT